MSRDDFRVAGQIGKAVNYRDVPNLIIVLGAVPVAPMFDGSELVAEDWIAVLARLRVEVYDPLATMFHVKLAPAVEFRPCHHGSGDFPALILSIVPDAKVCLFFFRRNRTAVPELKNVQAAGVNSPFKTSAGEFYVTSPRKPCHTWQSLVSRRFTFGTDDVCCPRTLEPSV